MNNTTDTLIPFEQSFEWHGLTVGIAKVGPELAKRLLETYESGYRKYIENHGNLLANDMQALAWVFAADPVKLGTNHNLIDGQHRLNAVILSGEAQDFLIVVGLGEEVYNVTDTGKGRRYSDLLRQRGYTNVDQTTALIKLVDKWNRGMSMDNTGKLSNYSLDKIFNYEDETKEGKKAQEYILRAVQLTVGAGRRLPITPSVLAFCWWLFLQIDVEAAHEFLGRLISGENLQSGMPVYALRSRLYDDRDIYYSRNQYLYMVFQAWNIFREGKSLSRVTLSRHEITRAHLNSRMPI